MKKILILLFSIILLPLSANASEVYYCLDDGKTGFDVNENFKQSKFMNGKFKIKIDFDNLKLTSDELYFNTDVRQKCFSNDETLYCMNAVGTSFSIHKPTLKYLYADIFNIKDMINDPRLVHGKCEKF